MFKNINKPLALVLRQLSTMSEQKILVNNVNINYVKTGSGEKSLLLMPGALGSIWTDFKPQIEKLPSILENYTIYAWDPPGYGKSIPPNRNYDMDFFQKDAELAHNLMRELNVDNYSALGWSDGGITALICAARQPKSVEKLVIWGANAYVIPEELKIYETFRDTANWSQKMREPLEKLYGAKYFGITFNSWVDIIAKILRERNGDICKTDLKNIKCDTFILHGDKDPMIDPQHIPYLMKEIKNVRLHRFPDGKHNIHLRYADEFNQLVADFLKNK